MNMSGVKVLITGITGFVGSHLAELLLAEKENVHGAILFGDSAGNIEHIRNNLHLHECDLKNAFAVKELIDKIKPDHIYHLAAQSFVKTSWDSPVDTFTTNVVGTLNLFEAVRAAGIKPRILLSGSGEEYGLVSGDELPVKETDPLKPVSPYAVSKITQDFLGYQYFKSCGIPTIRIRAFNMTGPRRGEDFVDSNFARQLVLIEKKMKDPVLEVGNLDPRRDFTDVRDAVKAYWLAMNKCEAGEAYNVCSGKAVKIHDLLDMLIRISGVEARVKQDKGRMRPADIDIMQGDNSKIRKATGWKPEIPLEKSLRDLLDYWRGIIT